MKVLLADNSPLVCERLEMLLRDVKGLTIVGKFHTMQDTIEMIERVKPDVVILDTQMQDGSGITVVRQVKREASAPIIVVLTNSNYFRSRKKYLQAGADFFFDKSFEFEQLPELLNELRVSVDSRKEFEKERFRPIESVTRT